MKETDIEALCGQYVSTYNRTEHAKEVAQSLIDSFLSVQYRLGGMKANRLLAIESGIVVVDFFLNKARKGDDYDYGFYEECRSQLIVLRVAETVAEKEKSLVTN